LQKLDLPGVAISNSTCFSPDGGTLYFCNSPEHRIMACDYDAASGAVRNVRVFTAIDDLPGVEPDGSTVDADGYLWSTHWGASRVVRYAPDGQVDLVLPLPASRPSCISFAGPALDHLCVTSAHLGMSEAEHAAEPIAGAVFYGRAPRGRGLPEARYGG
jgi:L-arabinonolactonase